MRSLAVVGLAWVVGCATSPAVELVTLSDTSDPATSTDATTASVASSEPGSLFTTETEATSEPATSAPVVETSSDAETSVPAPSTGADSSEPAVTTEVVSSETSDASSSSEVSSEVTTEAVTSDAVEAPELTLENVVSEFSAVNASSEFGSGFRAQVRQIDGSFYAMRTNNQGGTVTMPRFDPPLVEWVEGCDGSKAIVRIPPGMCATVIGDLKMTAQSDPSATCELDAGNIPSCANAEERSTRSQPSGLPTHTEITTITAYAYTDDDCAPDSAPVWSVLLYEGACGTGTAD